MEDNKQSSNNKKFDTKLPPVKPVGDVDEPILREAVNVELEKKWKPQEEEVAGELGSFNEEFEFGKKEEDNSPLKSDPDYKIVKYEEAKKKKKIFGNAEQ